MIKTKHTKTERVAAFIPVRLSSSRLPQKHFLKIGQKTILKWLVDNLKTCKHLDEIVIATAAEPINTPLQEFCEQHGIKLFWYQGCVDHVTTRLRKAAEEYHADICLLISGDCPLVHAPSIDQLVDQFRSQKNADIMTLEADHSGQHPALEGVILSRLSAWQKADDLADKPELKEHQFPLFWTQPELFVRCNATLPNNFYIRKHRFSVDTWADLEFMNRIHDKLLEKQQDFQLPAVLNLLQNEPNLFNINSHVHQRKLIDENHKVLFMIDAGDIYGFGHLMRSLELARQLTELKGWSTTFAVDNKEAENYLLQQGEKTLRAAFQRPARYRKLDKEDITESFSGYDLIVIDIFDQRDVCLDWRTELNSSIPVVVIDNHLPWTENADLIISPSVTVHSQKQQPDCCQHLWGKDHLIIRREVRRLKEMQIDKDLDLLVYLHEPDLQNQFKEFTSKFNLKAKIITNFSNDLPHLMASAKLYISGFGISFYEALALGTRPLCLPDSPEHREDALLFYQSFDLEPVILDETQTWADKILPLLKKPQERLPVCSDGTPQIVTALSNLVNGIVKR